MLSPPLLFGLGTEIDMFGSRWLIDELFNLGFSVSYSEIQRFKQAVVCSLETQNVISENLEGNSFIHFIADNIDHNLNTLDGYIYGYNISQGVHQGKAKIVILPIIDLNSSDYSCIYSTLLFVQDQARQLDVKTPCLTLTNRYVRKHKK